MSDSQRNLLTIRCGKIERNEITYEMIPSPSKGSLVIEEMRGKIHLVWAPGTLQPLEKPSSASVVVGLGEAQLDLVRCGFSPQ